MPRHNPVIDGLWDELNALYYSGEAQSEHAVEIARKILDLFGPADSKSAREQNVLLFTLPWDVLGEINKSIQAINEEVAKLSCEIFSGEYDDFPVLLREYSETLCGLCVDQIERRELFGSPEDISNVLNILALLRSSQGDEFDADALYYLDKYGPSTSR